MNFDETPDETPSFIIAQPYTDDELNTMHSITVLMERLDDYAARARVIEWAQARYATPQLLKIDGMPGHS